jgi:hypothetical protein
VSPASSDQVPPVAGRFGRVIFASVLVAACAATPQPSFSLPTLSTDSGACRGVGVEGTLAGNPSDARLAWIDLDHADRQEVIWPPGFRARFAPDLEIVDATGTVVLRDRDRIAGGCTAGGPEDPGAFLLIHPEP